MPSAYTIGDRVELRDQAWRVLRAQDIGEGRNLLEVELVGEAAPVTLSVVTPPEVVLPLPPEGLGFDPAALDSFTAWQAAHRVLEATLVSSVGVISGARFGRVAPEPYQRLPTLRLLDKPRPRLLLADDVGLGKTIEAGLAILELLARGRARRVLIVTPPGLMTQWRDELHDKFRLDFEIIENAAGMARVVANLAAGANPWDCLPRVITSLDYIKKDAVRHRALRKRWDLVIVDEAHALAEAGTPLNPYRTQRSRLGADLRDGARGLLLLTATPHNGYEHSFRSLLELVDPTAATLHGANEDLARRVARCMVRRLKSQIRRRRADGTFEDVFPPRTVRGLPIPVRGRDREILDKIAAYCSRTARDAQGGDDADLISFAMQIVKKRALSSRRALEQTIEHRLEALRHTEMQEAPPERADLRELQADLPLSEAAAERTARRILRAAVPKEERRRRAEVRALNSIRQLLRAAGPKDPKVAALVSELQRILAESAGEKVIVFTEYRDTLDVIRAALDAEPQLRDRSVVLRGGLSLRQRLRVQEAFDNTDVSVLLATDAASEGLNLQRHCRRVIHFELPWNPNRLEQRNGRVDRYGQTRPPEIRYLFYPESPEDDVLNRLVEKIERMRGDRVATPDILGVVAGLGDLEARLVDLDPEASQVERAKEAILDRVDGRAEEFRRTLQPLLTLASRDCDELAMAANLAAAESESDPKETLLEDAILSVLGPRAVEPGGPAGVHRIYTPLPLRGEGVAATYLAGTFRRDVATRTRRSEVEYFTPLHPLVQAVAAESRRRLAQSFPDARTRRARRLAACATVPGEPGAAFFTYLVRIRGASGLLEERLISAKVGLDATLQAVHEGSPPILPQQSDTEVDAPRLQEIFAGPFPTLRARAELAAAEWAENRAQQIRDRLAEQADALLRDLERDVADRLAEPEAEARNWAPLAEGLQGQGVLPLELPPTELSAQRRALIESQAAARREEIAEFRSVDAPAPPIPLGALLLVPGAGRR